MNVFKLYVQQLCKEQERNGFLDKTDDDIAQKYPYETDDHDKRKWERPDKKDINTCIERKYPVKELQIAHRVRISEKRRKRTIRKYTENAEKYYLNNS